MLPARRLWRMVTQHNLILFKLSVQIIISGFTEVLSQLWNMFRTLMLYPLFQKFWGLHPTEYMRLGFTLLYKAKRLWQKPVLWAAAGFVFSVWGRFTRGWKGHPLLTHMGSHSKSGLHRNTTDPEFHWFPLETIAISGSFDVCPYLV